jgi:hypothetical protein
LYGVKLRAARLARDFGLAVAVAAAAMLLFFRIAPEPRQPVREAKTAAVQEAAPVKEDSEETVAEDLRRAIWSLDSTYSRAIGGEFSDSLDSVRDNIEATSYMLTTPGRSGLEKQIGLVKEKIRTLRDEMTNLALYTENSRENSN